MNNVTIKSHLTVPQWKQNWEERVIRDIRENDDLVRPQDCFTGDFDSKNEFHPTHHKEYEAKTLSIHVSFYGKLLPTDDGCEITGIFKRKKTVNIFLCFGAILTLFVMFSAMYMQDLQNAVVGLVLFIVICVIYVASPSNIEKKILEELKTISFTDNVHVSKKAKKYLAKK